MMIGIIRMPLCSMSCCRSFRRVLTECVYAYPNSSADWKNTMQVFQTCGVPPSFGRISFPIIG